MNLKVALSIVLNNIMRADVLGYNFFLFIFTLCERGIKRKGKLEEKGREEEKKREREGEYTQRELSSII